MVRGTDVRGILGGHLHYSTHSLFAGVPISVAAATCYTMNLVSQRGVLAGVNGGQSINVVTVYDDQIVHSTVPIGDYPVVTSFPAEFVAKIESLSPAEQQHAFSRQVPPSA